jgi:guanosine-3',5'-bis(diphosphate) 3'-pyrophosphohydrolase
MPSDLDLLLEAASFAARAHRHQLRKDKETPYAAHTFRVCLIARHVFGIADPKVLAAALLHDTIEDTTTDYDDLAERFGPDVARWAAGLTKDMRLPDDEREAVYRDHLAHAEWPVLACKLADIYDNLTDTKHLSEKHRERTLGRSRSYLDAMRPAIPPELKAAFELTEAKCREVAGL